MTQNQNETLTWALGAALDARDELTAEVERLRARCRALTAQLNKARPETLEAA